MTKLLPPLALVGALALVPVTASSFAAADTTNYQELEKFMSVYERVKANYVDQVDDKTLIKGAIDGMLSALDPHSSYVEASDFDQLKTTTDGNYGGLGLTVSIEDGAVKVIAPTEDTPAWRAGIKSGDYITHINGELIYGLTLDEAVDKMRGEPGTPIKLTIVRPGRDKPFDVTMTRERIELRPVKWEIRDGIGYININTFSGNVADQTKAALLAIDKATGGHPLGYVVDLRSNPGGLLDQAVDVSRRLPRQRRDRLAARPREGRHRALLRAARRHGPRPAGDRAGRCRHRLGVGDRRRRAPGSSPRADHGREELRQGLGPDRRPDRSAKRAAADHRALLHAVGPLGSGRRDRARHRRAAAHATPITRTARVVREADLRRHLLAQAKVEDELLEDDDTPDPRFTADRRPSSRSRASRTSSSIMR